jgi:D-alanyl-D-alanine carboxypeptidase
MSTGPSARLLVGLLATAVLVALSVGVSVAADRGHRQTRQAMDAAVAAGAPGVLAEADDARGAWNASAGVGNRRSGKPLRAGDRFRIGSITKTFVATVVLQLEADGRLDLDDSVAAWLPGLVHGHGNDGRRITVRELLNHTSGLYDYTADPHFRAAHFGRAFLRHRYDTHTPAALVHTATAHPPLFAPGVAWHYSNTDYVLAGMVIKAVTGHGYAHEIRRRILRPLGLHATSLPGSSPRLRGRHGHAYSRLYGTDAGDGVHDVTDFDPSLAGASGEMVSTTGDLIRFVRALLAGRLLPHRQLAEMMTHTVSSGSPRIRYGLGLRTERLPCGTTVWGHDGGIYGSQAAVFTTRDGRHAAAFDFNGDWAGDTGKLLAAEFCG